MTWARWKPPLLVACAYVCLVLWLVVLHGCGLRRRADVQCMGREGVVVCCAFEEGTNEARCRWYAAPMPAIEEPAP